MRELKLIPFPADGGFALGNIGTVQVSSVIPIGQRGLTGAKFPDGTIVLVNIEARGSGIVVALAEKGDSLVCPDCNASAPELAILVSGNTYEVRHIVRTLSISLRSGGIFGMNFSMLDLFGGYDPRGRQAQRPSRSENQNRGPFGDDDPADDFDDNLDGVSGDFDDDDDDFDDDDEEEKDGTDVEASAEIEASVSGEVTDSSATEEGISLEVVDPAGETLPEETAVPAAGSESQQ